MAQAAAQASRGKPGQLLPFADAWGHNSTLRTCVELRQELSAIWGRSSASQEQLLRQLQAWCQTAEHSGIQVLEEFSLRLRASTRNSGHTIAFSASSA